MPMMRFPGTVSRPAETMVKQMDLISSFIHSQRDSSIQTEATYSRSTSPLGL